MRSARSKQTARHLDSTVAVFYAAFLWESNQATLIRSSARKTGFIRQEPNAARFRGNEVSKLRIRAIPWRYFRLNRANYVVEPHGEYIGAFCVDALQQVHCASLRRDVRSEEQCECNDCLVDQILQSAAVNVGNGSKCHVSNQLARAYQNPARAMKLRAAKEVQIDVRREVLKAQQVLATQRVDRHMPFPGLRKFWLGAPGEGTEPLYNFRLRLRKT